MAATIICDNPHNFGTFHGMQRLITSFECATSEEIAVDAANLRGILETIVAVNSNESTHDLGITILDF